MEQFFMEEARLISQSKDRISRTGLAFFTMTVVAQLAAIFLYELIALLFPALYETDWIEWTVTILCLYGFAALPAFLILRGVPASAPEKRRMPVKSFLMFMMIAFFFVSLGSNVGQAVNGTIDALTGTEQGSEITDAINGSALWLTAIYSLVIAPIMEELFFRKLLVDRLAPLGGWIAIILSGLFFGLFHGNIDQFFYAALLGALFAYVYLNTGNVWIPILMHSIVNFFGGILPTLFVSGVPDFFTVFSSGDAAQIEDLFLAYPLQITGYMISAMIPSVLSMVGLVLLIVYGKRLLRYITPCTLPAGKRVGTVVGNAGFLLYTLISIAMMGLVILNNIAEYQAGL